MRIRPRLLPLLLLTLPLAAGAQQVIRHPLPNHSSFPISAAVEVPAGKTMVYLSGMVPPVLDAKAPGDSVAAYGDTRSQTVAVLKAIEAELKSLQLGMGDVVKMQVFLVAPPASAGQGKAGRMDFAGFMQGYTQFFGTASQPQLPVRSAMQVAALANPGYLVEIEVTAVRP